jgi:putative transposase
MELGHHQTAWPRQVDLLLSLRHPGRLQPLRRRLDGGATRKRRAGQPAPQETCHKQIIPAGQLTVHADRGSSMRSKAVAFLLADLSITETHSRPNTSNDNPYSESQFRTLKYRPEFPDRFGCLQDSRAFCHTFFPWYNDDHRHSGIGMMTPARVHYGLAPAVRQNRQLVLDAAYSAHPDRFVRRSPTPLPLPKEVWINKP